MSNVINHKRVMLANLRIGQCISFIDLKQGQPTRVEAKITRIQIEQNFGQVWTRLGPLTREPLTFKYNVVGES